MVVARRMPPDASCLCGAGARLSHNKDKAAKTSMSAPKWFIAGCLVSGGVFIAVPQGVREESALAVEVAAAAPAPAPANAPDRVSGLPDFTRLIERVGPSVVNITTRSLVRHAPGIAERHFDVYRELMGEATQRTVTGLGSGFVLGHDGYILTNAHVVEGVDEVYVRLTGSKRELKAKIVGMDAATDIALLKVSARGLRAAPVGSSRRLRVGDWVAAIGSPFGFDNTITAGIISAKERNLPSGSPTRFLQSDVAINPGSSGGPLVNLSGEVVGINSKIYTRTGGYMGVSFAIPIETALEVSKQLRSRGSIARGFLGIEAQPVSEVLAASFNLDPARGALVTAVRSQSPASRAGIRAGDIVLGYGGKSIEEPSDLMREVSDTAPGTRTDVELWRRNALLHAAIIVDSASEWASAHSGVVAGAAKRTIGLVLTEVAPGERDARKFSCGLLVERADDMARPGTLQSGDVIVAVSDAPFRTRAEFDRLVEARAGQPVALLVLRSGRSQYVALESEAL
ncbi:MAG: PDZ domain-containing protein [Betaproteobacteria bacterium]|nr:PDZ domain-containing protein [Betaproteobacteria bacterium]